MPRLCPPDRVGLEFLRVAVLLSGEERTNARPYLVRRICPFLPLHRLWAPLQSAV